MFVKDITSINNYDYSIFIKKKFFYIYLYNKNNIICWKQNKNIKEIKKNIHINIQAYLLQFNYIIFLKIKFTGKGYKIKKNSNKSMVLLFNRAHITNIWWKNIKILKIKKYKIYVKLQKINLNIVSKILNIRFVNIFTKKGLRLSKQILFKKKGKK